ncbi:MAG: type II and III secretion system family protein [Pseudomonadota bacterium]
MILIKRIQILTLIITSAFSLQGCADATIPDARNVEIPSPISAQKRQKAVNERPDSVMYLPLGEDVLVPERMAGDKLPDEIVGPYELRGETLAGALQLVLSDYDISIAFETEEGLARQVTVANLKGPLSKVVKRICSLADLYCSYEDGAVVVKDTQTFTVTLPPLTDADGNSDYINDVIQGLTAVIGSSGTAPVSDPTTRTLIYSATQRTARLADNYFQRLRANTAMIVFETYIWEVSLNSGNSTGIDWDMIENFGNFNTSIGLAGSVGADFTNPVSIGLPTTQAIGATPTDLVEFLSQFGAVKTISQPQITVLSGSSAQLRVADTENYVAEVSQTINGDNTSTSVNTDSVDSGFTLTIGSSWDKATVYANVNINLTNVDQIEDFVFSDGGAGGTDTIIQLPQTTERELATQIRVRPGDSVLIAGLVRERDNFSSRGPGFMKPVLPDSRTAQTDNLELVILLKPRVIVYTGANDKKYINYINEKTLSRAAVAPAVVEPAPTPAPTLPPPVFSPEPVVEAEPLMPIEVEVEDSRAVKITPTPQNVAPAPAMPEPVVAPAPALTAPSSVYEAPEVYSPRSSSSYTPGYLSRSYESYEPSVSEDIYSFDSEVYSSPISQEAPSSVPTQVTPRAPVSTPTPINRDPLPMDIYQSAQPMNVYEAYERSQISN